jgi:hypothetical protein
MANKSPSKRRPRSIKILGQKINIRYVKELICDEDEILHGSYNGDKFEILINKDSDIHATLCHEIIHAALHISGITQRISIKEEESICTALENGLKDYLVF